MPKFLTILLLTTLAASPLEAQSLFEVGNLGGYTAANGLNSSNQVVGAGSSTSNGTYTAYLFSGSSQTNLIPAGTDGSVNGSTAYAINNSGQIVGTINGTSDPYAFLYSNGTVTNLSGAGSEAFSINNSGQVVGYYYNPSGYSHAYLYSGGTLTDLGSLAGATGSSSAWGINTSGQVTGNSSTSGGSTVAFLYSGGTMSSLGTLPGANSSYAYAINDAGNVVGYSTFSDGSSHAFLYSSGTMHDIGTLSGHPYTEALSINSSNVVVGVAGNSSNQNEAFIYYSATLGIQTLDTVYSSLLVSGGTGSPNGFTDLTSASGINNAGDIAGIGTYWNGSTLTSQAFLLDPTAAPEPSTVVLLLGGIGALAFFSYRRRPARS